MLILLLGDQCELTLALRGSSLSVCKLYVLAYMLEFPVAWRNARSVGCLSLLCAVLVTVEYLV